MWGNIIIILYWVRNKRSLYQCYFYTSKFKIITHSCIGICNGSYYPSGGDVGTNNYSYGDNISYHITQNFR